MTWRDPDLLWLLLTLPSLAVVMILAARWRRRAFDRFGDRSVVAGLVEGRRSAPWRASRAAVLLLAIGLVIAALAGPRYGTRMETLRKRGVDLVFVVDFSKSMLARDVHPDRVKRAKAEIARFVRELDGDRVGVVLFAGETIEFPLTYDYPAVDMFLDGVGPYDMPVGGTAIGRALVSAKRLMERSSDAKRARVVVLLTDGEDHEGDPVDAARELRKSGIRAYVVGIGSRTGEPIPTYSPDGTWTGYLRDEAGQVVTTSLSAKGEHTLRRIARETGGRYFRAGVGDVGLERVAAALRRMKQTELKARRVTVYEERYAFPLALALLLVVLEAMLPDRRLVRRERRLA